MSTDFQKYVKDNIWCTPGQDNQLYNRPRKIHSSDPVFVTVSYLKREIPLPNKTTGWFIYSMGTRYEFDKYIPFYQNDWESEKWVPLSVPAINSNVLTTLFTLKGIVFPLFRSFYLYTKEGALLIAIENNPLIPANLRTEDLYIRIYKNAYFDSIRNTDRINNKISTNGLIITNSESLKTILNTISYFRFQPGYCFVNVNGKRYRNTVGSFINIGDYIEYIYDPTIDHVETLFVNSLSNYFSIADNDNKYILNTSSNEYFTSIAFRDDLDIDIFTPISPNEGIGVIYPVIDRTSIRMLTHRSYSVRMSYVNNIINNLRLINPSTMQFAALVEIKFRKSGYKRDLIPNIYFPQDLHNLPFSRTNEAYIQNPVTFFPFSAYTQEQGVYTRAMSGPVENLTSRQLTSLFGYNSLIKAFSLKNTIVNNSVNVPEIYNGVYSVYEYDSNGQYLNNYQFSNPTSYTPNNNGDTILEFVSGLSSSGPSVIYGLNNLPYNPIWSYRVYACNIVNNIPQYDWIDITNTDDYISSNNVISWSDPVDPRFMMVRDDSKFTIKDFSINSSSNLLTFQLTEMVNLNDGNGVVEIPLQVAPSDIVIFMNNRSLVRGIDYFIDFPNVYITNFKFYNQNGPQVFHYRLTGLGLHINNFDNTIDTGLVSHGFIGTNKKYVPKNDKNARVIIDGLIKPYNSYKFDQDDLRTIDINNTQNGLPYQVQHMAVSITSMIGYNQEENRGNYLNLDNLLTNFMTPRFRFFDRGYQKLHSGPYPIVCPFFSKLIDDLLNNTITNSQINPGQTDDDIINLVEPYIYLLQFSPCNPELNYIGNSNYNIRPSPKSNVIHFGNQNAVVFLTRVSLLVTPNAIPNISNYISI